MKLREIGEFGLIARVKNSWPASSQQVIKGIGDEAAVSSLSPGYDLVSTMDLLVEEKKEEKRVKQQYTKKKKQARQTTKKDSRN